MPSNRYIVLFLKNYIERIERVPDYNLDDELIEFYVSLAATTEVSFAPSGMCYKTYVLDKEQYTRIVLREEQMLISSGTTGFQTWEAGLRLADFFTEHPDIIRGKNVVDLGAGCGLAGFACAAMGASRVVSTDFSDAVLKLLESNRKINHGISDKIQVSELDWVDTEACAKLSKEVDVIIGGDIAYDPSIVPTLVGALKAMVLSSQQVVYVTTTIRNPETFELFLELIDDTGVLGRSVMDLTETKMTALCHPNPSADIRLVLITRN
ncbi:S-adenosyl-L-methionine-dependent methyltransferase [Coemansia reversa NRRL 1564]|uniref:S-adenosyl-L-methionine-dependent methyltransferase n=1 Tax=Coemansia reversa (strain ATCC 12441 / NRRL 1564) TaxID=763665 RepID=A0A2G5BB48_COERN|nr:S-adenosyl-L-methionine-dependent methyltransferase [Coemansia reversa NRRL 1564]|eukprot:PIA16238.1 S-adenosyl-L-methionine-dependent methyltransferase [Coemansia reversa NRRL 1564]